MTLGPTFCTIGNARFFVEVVALVNPRRLRG
jgi:hypothetical protein